jgi:hypothetical protein
MTRPPNQPLESCPNCGCPDLFIRKDFPQKFGLLIVAGAGITFLILAANPHRFYLAVCVLAAATALDALLYLFVRRITVCYRCRAAFRDVPLNPKHHGFDLSTGEKYRT